MMPLPTPWRVLNTPDNEEDSNIYLTGDNRNVKCRRMPKVRSDASCTTRTKHIEKQPAQSNGGNLLRWSQAIYSTYETNTRPSLQKAREELHIPQALNYDTSLPRQRTEQLGIRVSNGTNKHRKQQQNTCKDIKSPTHEPLAVTLATTSRRILPGKSIVPHSYISLEYDPIPYNSGFTCNQLNTSYYECSQQQRARPVLSSTESHVRRGRRQSCRQQETYLLNCQRREPSHRREHLQIQQLQRVQHDHVQYPWINRRTPYQSSTMSNAWNDSRSMCIASRLSSHNRNHCHYRDILPQAIGKLTTGREKSCGSERKRNWMKDMDLRKDSKQFQYSTGMLPEQLVQPGITPSISNFNQFSCSQMPSTVQHLNHYTIEKERIRHNELSRSINANQIHHKQSETSTPSSSINTSRGSSSKQYTTPVLIAPNVSEKISQHVASQVSSQPDDQVKFLQECSSSYFMESLLSNIVINHRHCVITKSVSAKDYLIQSAFHDKVNPLPSLANLPKQRLEPIASGTDVIDSDTLFVTPRKLRNGSVFPTIVSNASTIVPSTWEKMLKVLKSAPLWVPATRNKISTQANTHYQTFAQHLRDSPSSQSVVQSREWAESKTVVIFCKRDFVRFQAVLQWRKYQDERKRKRELVISEIPVAGKRTRYRTSRYIDLDQVS